MLLMSYVNDKSTTKTDIAPPVKPNKIFLVTISISLPNDVSIVASKVIIETHAEVKLMVFAIEYTGDLSLLYFIKLIIAIVKAVKVYAAKAMVVIS